MKILFFGTPRFAEIVLEKLFESQHKVVGVVARADKPAGRGNKMVSPKTVEMARQKGLAVFQPEKISEQLEDFRQLDCDIFVTASYGKILPKSLLDIHPCINVHPSLLPKLRGATPIQGALLAGQSQTGVSIMKTEVGMDDGDIFVQEKVEISPEDDYATLMPKLANVGAKLLLQVLDEIEAKGFENVPRTPQQHEDATFVKLIKKEDAIMDFALDAKALECQVRAYCESPVSYFFVGGERVKVFKAKALDRASCEQNFAECFGSEKNENASKSPKNGGFCNNLSKNEAENSICGKILCTKKRFIIGAKNGALEILRCQAPGGKVLDAAAFLNGFHFKSDAVDKVSQALQQSGVSE